MSVIIQEALDNKPFILQLVENLRLGKGGGSSNNVFDGTAYQYTDSNIPKSTPLNAQGIAEAIDQISILTAAANILPNLKQPIDVLRQHITAELCSSRYTNIKELLHTRLANLSSIDTMLKDLHDRL